MPGGDTKLISGESILVFTTVSSRFSRIAHRPFLSSPAKNGDEIDIQGGGDAKQGFERRISHFTFNVAAHHVVGERPARSATTFMQ